MSKVQKLPSAATSYYSMKKVGRFFDIVLVTPCPGKDFQTRLYRFTDREAALEFGKDAARDAKRPFKYRGATA